MKLVAPTLALEPERPGTELVLDVDPGLVVFVPKALLPEVEPPPKPELPNELPDEEPPNELPPNELPDEEPNDKPPPELPPPPPKDEPVDWANAGAPASSQPAHARPRA
jgi:hypothetical protein